MLATHNLNWQTTTAIVILSVLSVVLLTFTWIVLSRDDIDLVPDRTRELVDAGDEPDATGNQDLEAAGAADDPAVLVRADQGDTRVKGDGHR